MPFPDGSGRLLDVENVAAELHVTEETVRRWLRSGELRGIRLSRKAGWRIRESDLQAFLDRRTSGGESSNEAP